MGRPGARKDHCCYLGSRIGVDLSSVLDLNWGRIGQEMTLLDVRTARDIKGGEGTSDLE